MIAEAVYKLFKVMAWVITTMTLLFFLGGALVGAVIAVAAMLTGNPDIAKFGVVVGIVVILAAIAVGKVVFDWLGY